MIPPAETFCPATALDGSAALPFVIPSAAEGSAVPRTIPGNVFDPRSTSICVTHSTSVVPQFVLPVYFPDHVLRVPPLRPPVLSA
jgi:hypothetical protein